MRYIGFRQQNDKDMYRICLLGLGLIGGLFLHTTIAHASAWTLRSKHQFLSVDYQTNWEKLSSSSLNGHNYRKDGVYLYYGYGLTDKIDLGLTLQKEELRAKLWMGAKSTSAVDLTSTVGGLWSKYQLFDKSLGAKTSNALSISLALRTQLGDDEQTWQQDLLNYRDSRDVLELGINYGIKFEGDLQRSLRVNNDNLPYSNQHHFFSSSLLYSKIMDSFYDEIHWNNTLGLRMNPFSLLLLETFTTIPIREASNHSINLNLGDRITKQNAQISYLPINNFQMVKFNEYNAIDNNTKIAISSILVLSNLLSVKLGYEYTTVGRNQDNQVFSIALWYSW